MLGGWARTPDPYLQPPRSWYRFYVVVTKIRDMKDIKPPGVDEIPLKLLLKNVEQISIQLATVFNLSLEEVVVPFQWKKGNIILFFLKVREETSQRTIDQ